MAFETVLRDAVCRHTVLRHQGAPFVSRSRLRHLNDLPADLKCRRTRKTVVEPEHAGAKSGRSDLRHAARSIWILEHEHRDRVRRVVLVHAGRRKPRMNRIEGVERTRTRSASKRQLFLLSWRKRDGPLWPRHIPVVVHPHFQLSGDRLACFVFKRHGKQTRSAGMNLGDAQRPEELVLAGTVYLLRKRPYLNLHTATLIYRRQVCSRR